MSHHPAKAAELGVRLDNHFTMLLMQDQINQGPSYYTPSVDKTHTHMLKQRLSMVFMDLEYS